MIVYVIIMFAAAALILVFSVLIYRGKTELIHDYHQTFVKDKAAYGRAFGKALCCLSLPLILAGVLALTVPDVEDTLLTTGVTIGGLIVAAIPLMVVQHKYNKARKLP